MAKEKKMEVMEVIEQQDQELRKLFETAIGRFCKMANAKGASEDDKQRLTCAISKYKDLQKDERTNWWHPDHE